jgi:hypothetical protein
MLLNSALVYGTDAIFSQQNYNGMEALQQTAEIQKLLYYWKTNYLQENKWEATNILWAPLRKGVIKLS